MTLLKKAHREAGVGAVGLAAVGAAVATYTLGAYPLLFAITLMCTAGAVIAAVAWLAAERRAVIVHNGMPGVVLRIVRECLEMTWQGVHGPVHTLQAIMDAAPFSQQHGVIDAAWHDVRDAVQAACRVLPASGVGVCDLRTVFRALAQRFACVMPAWAEFQVGVAPGAPCVILVDSVVLQQVLGNALDNAGNIARMQAVQASFASRTSPCVIRMAVWCAQGRAVIVVDSPKALDHGMQQAMWGPRGPPSVDSDTEAAVAARLPPCTWTSVVAGTSALSDESLYGPSSIVRSLGCGLETVGVLAAAMGGVVGIREHQPQGGTSQTRFFLSLPAQMALAYRSVVLLTRRDFSFTMPCFQLGRLQACVHHYMDVDQFEADMAGQGAVPPKVLLATTLLDGRDGRDVVRAARKRFPHVKAVALLQQGENPWAEGACHACVALPLQTTSELTSVVLGLLRSGT